MDPAEIAGLGERIAGLAAEIAGLAERLAAIADVPLRTEPRPPLPAACLHILREAGGPLRARQVYDRLVERGWAPVGQVDPFRSVRVTLIRLAQRGDVDRPAEGLFVAKPQQ